jgi:hypothetical protein
VAIAVQETAGWPRAALAVFVTAGIWSFPDFSAAQPVDFARDIQPILQERCQQCHGGIHRQSELSLLTRADAVAALPSGLRAISPGRPNDSELLRRITAADESERMPPEGKPLSAQEIDVLRRWIADGAAWEPHWSFRPLRRPAVPNVAHAEWVRTPIDRFVLSRLEAARGSPSPEAPRHTLIRRLHLDLLGLLPDVAEVDALCSDSRPDWYERLVDDLLASPHFGERWGRHWLDQARYADTDGFEVDGPRPDAWVWRDWVIAAFNEDRPFDRFTVEQLAGDLLPDATPEQKLATAFQRQSLTNREGGIDKAEARYKELVDRVNAVGTVWLGLTIGCAQCHNHPYDPFTQREYYELYAFFNRSEDSQVRVTSPRSSKEIEARVVARSDEPLVTTIYRRGDFLQLGDAVQPSALQRLHLLVSEAEVPDRLDLARWIASADNPLAPRVAVNQIWLRLFGEGLVRTPDDFGARGQPPTHPQLLDWLADEYRSSGWSTKRIIRLIVTSAAYRQSSQHRPEWRADDSLNTLWHRQIRYRVEAEIIRDLHLDAAAMLTRELGGPGIYPPLADDVAKLSFRSNYVWPTSVGRERHRRGLYVFYKRTLPYPNLDTFDCPDATAARMQRETSNTPLQALTLLNHQVHVEAARGYSRRVLTEVNASDTARIDLAFRIALGRTPTDEERRRLQDLLVDCRSWYDQHGEQANALMDESAQDGVDARETAAWTVTLAVVLNLDEFVTRE